MDNSSKKISRKGEESASLSLYFLFVFIHVSLFFNNVFLLICVVDRQFFGCSYEFLAYCTNHKLLSYDCRREKQCFVVINLSHSVYCCLVLIRLSVSNGGWRNVTFAEHKDVMVTCPTSSHTHTHIYIGTWHRLFLVICLSAALWPQRVITTAPLTFLLECYTMTFHLLISIAWWKLHD